jgi:hypothetical protein
MRGMTSYDISYTPADRRQVTAFISEFIMPGASFTHERFPLGGFWVRLPEGKATFILPNEPEYVQAIEQVP